MNSEISNVLKISPVTVVKAEKQTGDRQTSSIIKDNVETNVSNLNETTKDSTKSFSTQNPDGKEKDEPNSVTEQVKKAVDQGNNLLQAIKRNLQFTVDESSHELVVKIVDSDSGETVRQIPSEEMLAFIKRMQELEGQQGSVIQDRA